MTTEEAVRILRHDAFNTKRTHEAVLMAIEALRWQNTPDTNDGDTVSRQAVIDAYYESLETSECGTALNDEKFLKHISQLTPTKPKTGRWIDIDSETYTWKIRCDQCGHERSMMSTQGKYPNFCEGCGAEMMEGRA